MFKRASIARRCSTIPPYPKKPWGFRRATHECDYGGFSCHHCFKCNAFSDKFPNGKHWPCEKHWTEFSWYCLGCNQVAHARWGSSTQWFGSCKCPHCGFNRNGRPEDLDPLRQAQLKLHGITAEKCEVIAESLCGKLDAFVDQHDHVHQFQGTWKVVPEAAYHEVMNLPATTINGYGMELDHPVNVFRQKIYRIMYSEPCTLSNLLHIACYNAFLSTQRAGMRVEDLIHDIPGYYAKLTQACIPTTIMIEQSSPWK